MVIPPVVVSADVVARTPRPAAVLIEMAMRPSRDKGAVPAKALSVRVSRRGASVNPVLEVFCAQRRYDEYNAAHAFKRSGCKRWIFPLDQPALFQHP